MCTALICVFNILVLRVNPALDAALDRFLIWFFSVVLLLVFEPLCLHLFAATPGKWMLGITVRAWDGGKLSYREAYIRTRRVLIGGMGFYIPIAEPVANAIALWRSLKEGSSPGTRSTAAGSRYTARAARGGLRPAPWPMCSPPY